MPADRLVTARFHGGPMAGPPTFVCIHSAETPLADSYVASIAEFFRQGPTAGTSAHHMTGPRTWVQMLPENVVAYAAGPRANGRGIHVEQTGRAAFTRPQWTSPDGLALHRRTADCVREACARWGIPPRWCTDAQLKAAAAGQSGSGGLCTHGQVARVLGGTTHTDPGPNYPADVLLSALLEEDDMAGEGPEILRYVKSIDARVAGDVSDGTDRIGETWAEAHTARLSLVPDGRKPGADRLTDLWADQQETRKAVAAVDAKLDAVLAALKAKP